MIDLSKIISSAAKAAESVPGYTIHPDHANLITYLLQFVGDDGDWCFLTGDNDHDCRRTDYYNPQQFSYKEAVATCANLQAGQNYTQWRVVALIEVWREGDKRG